MKYPNIAHMLNAVFNANAALSEEAAKRIYVGSAVSSGKVPALKQELAEAFADTDLSWKHMLFNDEFEVFDAESEEEARTYANRILVEPLEHL